MKQIHLLFILALFGACAGKTQDHFVLRGHVPGAEDSTKVDMWSEDRSIRLSGYVVNETFELTGKAPMPMYCHLSMNNSDVARSKGLQGEDDIRYVEANFFVENGNLDFSVPHIDSLPQSFWKYDIRKENNYRLTGSASHKVYDRYRRKTMEQQYRVLREARLAQEEKREPDARLMHEMSVEIHEILLRFIADNRNLAVNLHLAQFMEMEPFTYNQANLDEITSLFARYTDTLPALRRFREKYAKAAAYTQGTPFAGGEVYTPKGDTLNLTKYMKPGRYMLIDFWASWCGPCRASFPHLRKVYQAYGKKLEFLSVSVDKNDADWRKAMKEEQLPWTQLCATKAFARDMGKVYQITSIPTFLIVDPEGKIVFSGHDSGELDAQLEKL